jgi:HD-like signal output (HDOD) protein/nitrogen-specific signal transduction histidine kinase
MEKIDRSRILQKIANSEYLPSPSPLITQLLDIAANDLASVQDLAGIIEQDPGLTTRLLKLVNTAFYAHRREVSSISQAIVILGSKKLRMMALSMSLRGAFPLGRVDGMDYEAFWKNSLYRALIAQGLGHSAPALRQLADGEVFTAGLILEIGMLMLFHFCPEGLRKDFPGGHIPLEQLVAWEEHHLGINHREVGRIVLKRWHFPDAFVESQQYFGADVWRQDRSLFCKALEFARVCAHLCCGARSDFEYIRETAPQFGLEMDRVNEVLCATFAKVEEIADQLRLRVSSSEDILEVMEKANQALGRINGSLETNLEKILGLMAAETQTGPQYPNGIFQERKRALENVLDAVAHEIRNPLMAIGGFAQRLAKNVEGSSNLQQYAAIIAQESARLEHVFNEVAAFSRVYQPVFTESDLIAILDSVTDALRDLAETKKIDLLRNYQREPLYLPLDQEAFQQALQQLLETLIQLVNHDGGKIWIEVAPPRAAQQAKIVIGCQGVAIPEDVRNVLLGLDFSSKAFGAGLGLLVSWKIFEAHRSRIELQTQDETSKLVIYLPLRS